MFSLRCRSDGCQSIFMASTLHSCQFSVFYSLLTTVTAKYVKAKSAKVAAGQQKYQIRCLDLVHCGTESRWFEGKSVRAEEIVHR